jgi:predicted lipoprotein with Yx(FWY)xxD motif
MAGMRMGGVRSVGIVAIGALLLLSACAKSTPTASGGGSTTAAAQSGGVTVGTTNVSGVGTVLTDPQGMVLYYLKTEKPGNIMCTGSCATAWPPLVLPSGTSSATAGDGVTGKLGTIERPDGGGTQVTYNGSPLYTFAGDKAGEASGQGVASFYAVVASGSGNSGGSNSGDNSGGGGGYGGGY